MREEWLSPYCSVVHSIGFNECGRDSESLWLKQVNDFCALRMIMFMLITIYTTGYKNIVLVIIIQSDPPPPHFLHPTYLSHPLFIGVAQFHFCVYSLSLFSHSLACGQNIWTKIPKQKKEMHKDSRNEVLNRNQMKPINHRDAEVKLSQ